MSIMIILVTSQTTTTKATTSANSAGTTTSTSASTTSTSRSTSTTSTSTSTTSATTVFSYVWNSTGTIVVNPSGQPYSLALDSSNALYVVETFQNRVVKYINGTSTNSTIVAGQPSGASNSTSNSLNFPSDVAVDSSDNVYVLDKLNNRVQFWANGASTGSTIAGIGGAGSAMDQFQFPYFMTRDPNTGTLYISDTDNRRIMRYLSGASNGTVVAGNNGFGYASNQLAAPSGIYFNSSSNSFVIANYLGNNIVRWVIGDSNWTLIAGSTNGSSGSSPTMLYHPMGLTVDPMGNIYVADSGNNRIQLFLAGQSNGTTIAGVNGSSATQLSNPSAVILDSQLNVYVADTGNSRVVKFAGN